MNLRFKAGARSREKLLVAFAVITAGFLSGCSLISGPKPVPGQEYIFCKLEYQPERTGEGRRDLLFLAGASAPYSGYQMSLPDVLLHSAFAPGRHLASDLDVLGARCPEELWKKGERLPASAPFKAIECERLGTSQVVFEIRTKWGTCREEIADGEIEPRLLPPKARDIWVPKGF